MVTYAFNNRDIKTNDFCYLEDRILSLYTAFNFWGKIIVEAWYQIISDRYVLTKYDEDDYLRLGLNYAIYKFKSLIREKR